MPIRLKGGRHKYQILIIMGSSKARAKADVRQRMRPVEKAIKFHKEVLKDKIKRYGPDSANANNRRRIIERFEERLQDLEDEMDSL